MFGLKEYSFRESTHIIWPKTKNAFFPLLMSTKIITGLKVCEALIYLLYNNFIIFGTKLYRQIVVIPIGTYCAPLVADLFLFFMREIS